MHSILGWFGVFGAAIVEIVITLGSIVAAIFAANFAWKRTKKTWICLVAGILAFVLLILIFGPIYEAAEKIDCRGTNDYQGCMGDD
jgi:cell division protein FtsW (lipid II flippase)